MYNQCFLKRIFCKKWKDATLDLIELKAIWYVGHNWQALSRGWYGRGFREQWQRKVSYHHGSVSVEIHHYCNGLQLAQRGEPWVISTGLNQSASSPPSTYRMPRTRWNVSMSWSPREGWICLDTSSTLSLSNITFVSGAGPPDHYLQKKSWGSP